jgi:hypothetical protein
MNWERSILISFLGNYLNNNVVAGIVALLPASTTPGIFTVQYVGYVILAAVCVGLLTWWYGARSIKAGAIFGLVGFVVAIATAFLTGITGVLTQTGSLSQMFGILPNFWPFIWNVSTIVLFAYWMVPAVAVGWYRGGGMKKAASAPAPMAAM